MPNIILVQHPNECKPISAQNGSKQPGSDPCEPRLAFESKRSISGGIMCHALLVSCGWQTKKKKGNMLYYWSRLVQTLDQLIPRLTANARRGSNGSEPVCFGSFCALIGWRSFDRWTRMKVGHVLRQCALFKPNHCNWSSYLQLYFKIIIFIYNFCNGKVSWTMNCRFVRNIDHCK